MAAQATEKLQELDRECSPSLTSNPTLGLSGRMTNEILVNGQNGAQADAPATSQTAGGEAEDDSDDDQEEGDGAPEAGAAGGR